VTGTFVTLLINLDLFLGRCLARKRLTCTFFCRLRRGEADGGYLVALAPHDVEAQTVEHKGLANFGNAPGLMEYEPRDGGGFFIWQIPLKLAIEVTDGETAIDDIGAIRLRAKSGHADVCFVGNVTDDLFEDIFKRHNTFKAAIFVDHQGKVFVAVAEGL